MRVLLLSSLWPPAVLGGAELHAAALADRLVEAGLRQVGERLDLEEVEKLRAVGAHAVYHLDQFADLIHQVVEPFRRDAFRKPRRLLPKYRKFSAKDYR